MDIFYHHIYEYKKGLRDLILYTTIKEKEELVKNRLQKERIYFVIHRIKDDKINVYFGDKNCVEIVKSFNQTNLSKLEKEQDFILGIMLGYNRLKQCKRYLEKISFTASF